VIPIVVCVTAFAAMEAVSYAAHRWIMHGPGIGWHRSHHAPANAGLERNDLFPLVFSVPTIGLFVTAAAAVTPAWTWWAAAGVTAYGAAYLVVHELVIHRRLGVPVADVRALRWLRAGHAAHHLDGGEPYGMLLPFVSSSRRVSEPSVLDSLLVRRASRRPMRSRL
jgi:beta-carotene 3-hydroxylase